MRGIRPHPTKHTRYSGETWWQVDMGRDESGKRQFFPFEGTLEEAIQFRKSALQNHEHAHTASIAPTIREMFGEWIVWYGTEHSKNTAKDIQKTFLKYMIPWFGNFRPNQLSRDLFVQFRTSLLKNGLKPVTINKHLNYFSSLIKWAVETKKCQPLTFDLPRFSKKKTVPEELPTPLTPRQINALYQKIEDKYKLIFLLMVDMGLRQSEAMQVRIEDVDEHNQTVRVIGKGKKERYVPFGSQRFEEELYKLLDTGRTDGYLSINSSTSKPYVTVRKPLERAAESAKIKAKVNHHVLRHTYATNMARGGVEAYALQRLLGHASIETTMKIYVHLGLDFVGDEVRKYRKRNGV